MGYIANLKSGLEQIDDHSIEIISRVVSPRFRYEKAIRILSCIIPFKELRKQFRKKLIDYFNVFKLHDVSLQALYYRDFIEILDKYDFDTITCHWVKDALFIRNYLESRKSRAKLILMSHSPEPPSEEVYAVEKLNGNPEAEKIIRFGRKSKKPLSAKRQIISCSLRKKPSNLIHPACLILKVSSSKSSFCSFLQDARLLQLIRARNNCRKSSI